MNINYTKYLDVCKRVLKDEVLFNSFRADVHYAGIVDTMRSYDWGVPYIKELKKQSYLWELMSKFSEADKICGAECFNYDGILISPNTLRYIKVLADLHDCFGNLDDFNIVEIGAGYGGQCKVIYDFAKVKSYTIVDLPEVEGLAKKWLSKFGINDVIFRDHNDLTPIKYDLLISNYAFTELDDDVKDKYGNAILRYSDMGFMICNFYATQNKFKKLVTRYLNSHCKSVTLPEEPETCVSNFIYAWKNGLD